MPKLTIKKARLNEIGRLPREGYVVMSNGKVKSKFFKTKTEAKIFIKKKK